MFHGTSLMPWQLTSYFAAVKKFIIDMMPETLLNVKQMKRETVTPFKEEMKAQLVGITRHSITTDRLHSAR